jgi:hypothetical protein
MPDRNEESSTRHQTRSRLSAGAQRQGNQALDGDGRGERAFGRVPSMVAQARMLMPQDSFGRELAAMANGGDTGMTGDDWSFVSFRVLNLQLDELTRIAGHIIRRCL